MLRSRKTTAPSLELMHAPGQLRWLSFLARTGWTCSSASQQGKECSSVYLRSGDATAGSQATEHDTGYARQSLRLVGQAHGTRWNLGMADVKGKTVGSVRHTTTALPVLKEPLATGHRDPPFSYIR